MTNDLEIGSTSQLFFYFRFIIKIDDEIPIIIVEIFDVVFASLLIRIFSNLKVRESLWFIEILNVFGGAVRVLLVNVIWLGLKTKLFLHAREVFQKILGILMSYWGCWLNDASSIFVVNLLDLIKDMMVCSLQGSRFFLGF